MKVLVTIFIKQVFLGVKNQKVTFRKKRKLSQPFKHQAHKIAKHTQTISRLLPPTNCLSVCGHFVGLAQGLSQIMIYCKFYKSHKQLFINSDVDVEGGDYFPKNARRTRNVRAFQSIDFINIHCICAAFFRSSPLQVVL